MLAVICRALDPAAAWHACQIASCGQISAVHDIIGSHTRSVSEFVAAWSDRLRAPRSSEFLQVRVQPSDFSMLYREDTDIDVASIYSSAAETVPRAKVVNYTEVYAELVARLRELNSLAGVAEWLRWDALTFMPPGAAPARSDQESTLMGIIHEKSIDKDLGSILQILNDAPDGKLSEFQRAMVKSEHKKYAMGVDIPKEVAQNLAEVKANAYVAWQEYNRTGNYPQFASLLQDMIDVSKETASHIDPTSKPYDVLLQIFEAGMTGDRLEEIFNEVYSGLVALGQALETSPHWPDASWLNGTYDTDLQAEICRNISRDMGFDADRGRLDVVNVNPFTTTYDSRDVRMTTCFSRFDITSGLINTMHETGHALYEQGRNVSPEWLGLPISRALSTGVHESQSLLWERHVSRGKPFQRYLLPKLKEAFPETFEGKTPHDLYEARNHWETEEIPFVLRMLIMYKLEKGLIEGSVKAIDIPNVWDKYHDDLRRELGMHEDRGKQWTWEPSIVPMTWCLGAFGYLPTYALGTMYACQMFECAKSKIPDLDESIARGDFTKLREFLNTHVHSLGSLPDSADELLERMTGSKLNPTLYLAHLILKYSEIYLPHEIAPDGDHLHNENYAKQNDVVKGPFDYSLAIEASEKDGEWERAVSLFDEMRNAGFGLDVINSNVDMLAR